MKMVFCLTQTNGLKEFAIKSAIDLDINLTNDHWLVIDMIRYHLFRHYCQVCKALESFDRKVT